jgi:hypothetical protein
LFGDPGPPVGTREPNEPGFYNPKEEFVVKLFAGVVNNNKGKKKKIQEIPNFNFPYQPLIPPHQLIPPSMNFNQMGLIYPYYPPISNFDNKKIESPQQGYSSFISPSFLKGFTNCMNSSSFPVIPPSRMTFPPQNMIHSHKPFFPKQIIKPTVTPFADQTTPPVTPPTINQTQGFSYSSGSSHPVVSPSTQYSPQNMNLPPRLPPVINAPPPQPQPPYSFPSLLPETNRLHSSGRSRSFLLPSQLRYMIDSKDSSSQQLKLKNLGKQSSLSSFFNPTSPFSLNISSPLSPVTSLSLNNISLTPTATSPSEFYFFNLNHSSRSKCVPPPSYNNNNNNNSDRSELSNTSYSPSECSSNISYSSNNSNNIITQHHVRPETFTPTPPPPPPPPHCLWGWLFVGFN